MKVTPTIRPQLQRKVGGNQQKVAFPNYAAHLAAGMGLTRGFPMRYELTFPDAPFAMTGSYLERIALTNSDVCLYLSESKAGRPFAIFFPGFLRDGAAPRCVKFSAKPASVSFTNKKDEPVTVQHVNGSFRVPLYVDGQGEPIYIWGKDIAEPAFKRVLATARVCEGAELHQQSRSQSSSTTALPTTAH